MFKILNYSELQIDILSGVDFNLNVFRLLTENFHRLSLNYFGSNGFIQLQGEDKERISFLLMQIKKNAATRFF